MIDLEDLNNKLDETLALETPESLNLWMQERIKEDEEAGIAREDYLS